MHLAIGNGETVLLRLPERLCGLSERFLPRYTDVLEKMAVIGIGNLEQNSALMPPRHPLSERGYQRARPGERFTPPEGDCRPMCRSRYVVSIRAQLISSLTRGRYQINLEELGSKPCFFYHDRDFLMG
jgi:hypothetical protein